jgi:hypothetical protein
MKPEDAQKKGLGTAYNIAQAGTNNSLLYPENYTDKLKGPAQSDYYDYQAPQNLQTYGAAPSLASTTTTAQYGGITPQAQYGSITPQAQYGSITPQAEAIKAIAGIGKNGYESVQDALQTPVYSQANKAQNNINSVYGANGLYGSAGNGLMSNALAEQNEATQNALANTVVNRYNLEMADKEALRRQAQNIFQSEYALDQFRMQDALNQFNSQFSTDQFRMQDALNQFNSQFSTDQFRQDEAQNQFTAGFQNTEALRDQALNQWKTGYTNTADINQYNAAQQAYDLQQQQAQNDWYNNLMAQNFNYDLNKNAYNQNQLETDFQRYLQLAGQGNSGASVQATIDAANANADATANAGLWSGIGSVAGGLLGASTGDGGSVGGSIWDSIGGSIWDSISGLW